eukprot:364555-Chlamydomonas_euryale.AAC.15
MGVVVHTWRSLAAHTSLASRPTGAAIPCLSLRQPEPQAARSNHGLRPSSRICYVNFYSTGAHGPPCAPGSPIKCPPSHPAPEGMVSHAKPRRHVL